MCKNTGYWTTAPNMKETPRHINDVHLMATNDTQPEVCKNAETARDWEYAEEAAYLYRIASVFIE